MEEPTTSVSINDQINTVVGARKRFKVANEVRTTAYEKWLEENQILFDTEKDALTLCQEAETKLKSLAVESYNKTGNKQVAVGIVIKVMTILNYDATVAFDWAKAHKIALKLDAKTFDKIAKADPPDFVKITEVPQATLAQELEKVEEIK